MLELATLKFFLPSMLFHWLCIFSEVPSGKPIFEIIEIHNFMMRRTQARSIVSFQITKFMKSDVRRTQATHHFIAFPLLPLGTSWISRNRHSHALRRSLFFLAAVRVPVHILDKSINPPPMLKLTFRFKRCEKVQHLKIDVCKTCGKVDFGFGGPRRREDFWKIP